MLAVIDVLDSQLANAESQNRNLLEIIAATAELEEMQRSPEDDF